MIASQRRAHKLIWLVIAVLVPIFLFFTIKNLTFSPPTNAQEANIGFAYSDFYKKVENEFVSMVFYGDERNHLELYVKKPLKSASSIVYALDKSGNKAHVLGKISGTGKYRFDAKIGISGILIHDVLKNREILKLHF